MTEEAPLRPLTAYAESKVRAEEGLAELADADFIPVFMRNATVYGVSPRLRFDVVLNNLAAWAYTTKRVRIMSDGTPWRPIVHIRDVAAATIALLRRPPSSSGRGVQRRREQRELPGASSPRSSARRFPAARSSTPKAPGPIRGATASTSASSGAPFRLRDAVDGR